MVHTDDKPFMCDICYLSFRHKCTLDKHKDIHNNAPKKFKCTHERCFHKFREKRNLIDHERTHTDEKPFKCDHQFCNQSFAKNSNMTAHKMTHDDKNKQTECPVENGVMVFKNLHFLKEHFRRFHGVEKYIECKVPDCGKKFKTK